MEPAANPLADPVHNAQTVLMFSRLEMPTAEMLVRPELSGLAPEAPAPASTAKATSLLKRLAARLWR